MSPVPIMKEAWSAARGQPVWSLVTAAMVAGLVIAVMATTGRSVAGQQEVLGTLDEAGTRAILVTADAGLDPEALEPIGTIEGVEWSGAFSDAVDASNLHIPGGQRVAVRQLYSLDLDAVGVQTPLSESGSPAITIAVATQAATTLLGMPDSAGAITDTNGASLPVAGPLRHGDYFTSLEPLVVVPRTSSADVSYTQLLVVAQTPELVGPIADAIRPLLRAEDPTTVTIETSQTLADVRAKVRDQLGTTGRALVFGMLATTCTLVGIVQFALVMFRRRDFGRRRALGATRSLIVGLVVAQTMWVTTIGAVVGVAASAIWLQFGTGYWPGFRFTVGLASLALLASAIAAVIPAWSASRRDPIFELRVP